VDKSKSDVIETEEDLSNCLNKLLRERGYFGKYYLDSNIVHKLCFLQSESIRFLPEGIEYSPPKNRENQILFRFKDLP
jgi:hypothetical protein